MAYAAGNPKTKKELKAMVARGPVGIFSPGFFPPKENGIEYVEGPQEGHRFYARVQVQNGQIVKVLS